MASESSPKKRGPSELTDEHKAAMAQGRAEGRAVRGYLEALEAHKPKRGRRRTPESIRARLAKLNEEIDEVDPLTRVQLIQERIDLNQELDALENKVDISALEGDFVAYAADYSRRKGISYAAWRELGVSPSVLKAAGIGRGN
jgi:hypothetical protein